MGLLEQPTPTLGETRLPVRPVLNPPQLHLVELPLFSLEHSAAIEAVGKGEDDECNLELCGPS